MVKRQNLENGLNKQSQVQIVLKTIFGYKWDWKFFRHKIRGLFSVNEKFIMFSLMLTNEFKLRLYRLKFIPTDG